MSHIVHELIAAGEARIVDQPVAALHEVDRSFGLPTALYGATIACYLGFLAIVGTVFANPVLVLPVAIMAFLIIAAFTVPAIWTRLIDNRSAPATQREFEARGIMTNTGFLSARDAIVQVLLLPVLLVVWGLAVAVIAATVT